MGPTQRAARIVVTRPAGREVELLRRLRGAGHDAVHVPLVAVEPVGDGPVDVDGYDWVVLTSVVGARELRRRMAGRPRRVAAIGAATAEAFGGADLVAERSTQEGMLAVMPQPAGRVLFAGAEGARRLLPEALGADVVVLYRTVELTPAFPDCRSRRARVPVRRTCLRRARRRRTGGVDRPRDDPRPRSRRACGLPSEATASDLDGLVDAVGRALVAD